MKLVLMPISGKQFVLCSEDLKPLPNQHSLSFDTGVNELSVVTVSFFIDGESIRLYDHNDTERLFKRIR